ncbi:restriction endonuclease subunit S [Frateuria soli]|uniref:restriction endonuclease subunit S n=1 Tax=Frateuria soli TaxID=1542730 RepID=UPI001E4D7380|nr:restriction endonuclease subunit S [Frateuria soli]UGB36873.1 restriction endonuclease subunit S [Frateuria soli]
MSSGISTSAAQAGHGAPFLSFSTVFNHYFVPDVLPDRMDTSESEQSRYSIRAGDVFLTRTSETVDELGMSCVALKDFPQATYSGFLKRLRPKAPGLTDPKFMAFYLRSPLFRKTMTNNAVMVLRASLNENIFSYLDLLLPDLDTQASIGEFLHLLMSMIDLNNRINAELEALAKTIYDYWFVQFDFPDAQGRPYKSSGGAMVWNGTLKREIPAGWDAGSLEALGKIAGGSTPSTAEAANFGQGMIPWITPKDLSNNKGNKFIARGETDVSEAGMRAASLTLYPAGTVLMSSRAPVGYLAIALNPVTTNQGFKSFVPSKGYGTSFVYYAVKRALPTIIQHASGSTFVEISGGVLKSVHAVLPDKAVTSAFCSAIEPIVQRQKLAELENVELTQLRDWLLPLLMNGQVRVA